MELNGKSNLNGESVEGRRNMEHITSSAHGAVDRVASGAHRAVDKIVGAAGSAAGTLSQKRERMTVASSELTDDLRGYVQSNPLVSIGIAAAVGYIFSRIIASR